MLFILSASVNKNVIESYEYLEFCKKYVNGMSFFSNRPLFSIFQTRYLDFALYMNKVRSKFGPGRRLKLTRAGFQSGVSSYSLTSQS